MRRLATILLLLLGAALSLAAIQRQQAAAVAHQATVTRTWLINQNFEGTGYDNSESWTENSTVDEDYTTTILRGSQSLQLGTATAYTEYTMPADESEIWGHVLIQVPDVTPASDDEIVFIRDSANTIESSVIIRSTGLLRGRHDGILVTGASGGDLANATTTRIWWHWKAETSSGAANGVFEVWTSTSSETDRADGSQIVSQTNGAMFEGARIIRLEFTLSANLAVYDQLLVDDEEFTTVDP